MNTENALFVEYIQTEDRVVFEKLFRLTKPWIYKFIYRIIPDKAIADDVFQETWIQILCKKNDYDTEQGRFNNYLFTCARNNALKAKERLSKYEVSNPNSESNELQFGINEQTPYNITEINEKNSLIMGAIESIDKKYQDVILLHYFADLDVKEIAINLNIPEGTVKTWLSRGREQLKGKLLKTNKTYYMSLFMVTLMVLCWLRFGEMK